MEKEGIVVGAVSVPMKITMMITIETMTEERVDKITVTEIIEEIVATEDPLTMFILHQQLLLLKI